jgi:hypothetical protein
MTSLILVAGLSLSLYSCSDSGDAVTACLPQSIKPETVVSTLRVSSAKGEVVKAVTVKDTLAKLKARCKRGKLVDGTGREIRFVELIGCWGNPPADYEEQMKRQAEELDRLKKSYTVVEIPCAHGRDIRLIN